MPHSDDSGPFKYREDVQSWRLRHELGVRNICASAIGAQTATRERTTHRLSFDLLTTFHNIGHIVFGKVHAIGLGHVYLPTLTTIQDQILYKLTLTDRGRTGSGTFARHETTPSGIKFAEAIVG